jgi:hypothetical protein
MTRTATRLALWCILGLAVVLASTPGLAALLGRRATAAGVSAVGELVSPRTRALAEYQLGLWSSTPKHDVSVAALRAQNPEWDLMARTFLVLALADMALRSPRDADRFVAAIDRIVHDTLAVERSRGQLAFLLPYVRDHRFVDPSERSLFVDGELALMLGVRQIVRPLNDDVPLLEERARYIERAMKAGPVLSGESYPDECWTFCNTTALAALRVFDAVRGTTHRRLFDDWVAVAKAHLVDPVTGLLVSSYTYRGQAKDGPEGSSIWMSARNLLLVDDAFARDQYERARRELAGDVLGFGYAREWPRSWNGPVDVDSGPVVPLLDASPSSSGFAILGAKAFDDGSYLSSLLASLDLTGLPTDEGGGLHYEASNAVGDAVILSGLAFGPVWGRVTGR